uniref:Uncharacterized protein n=1 Tax=Panagrolaimus sp. JU765 TaxID=591449 RepID=A0AC34PXX4_9BILA
MRWCTVSVHASVYNSTTDFVQIQPDESLLLDQYQRLNNEKTWYPNKNSKTLHDNLFRNEFYLPSFSKRSQPMDEIFEMNLKKKSQPMDNFDDIKYDSNGNLISFDLSNFSFNQKRSSQPMDEEIDFVPFKRSNGIGMEMSKKSQPMDEEIDFVPYKRSNGNGNGNGMEMEMSKKSQPMDDVYEMNLKKKSQPMEEITDFNLKKRSPLQIPEKMNQKNSQPMDDTTSEFSL